MTSFWKFFKGILLRGETSDPSDNQEGSLWHNSTTNRLKGYFGAAVREVATTDQTQTLTNKTIDGDDNTVQDLALGSLKTVLADANKVIQRDASGAVISGGVLPSGNLVTDSSTTTFTNKTIDGDDNTLQDISLASLKAVPGDANEVLYRDGSGNVTSANSMPAGTIVGTTDSQSLTNKTIDADLNTISNIDDADIKAGASIARNKLASGTADHVIINDGSGVLSSEAQLAKVRGGTGADNSAVTFPATGVIVTEAGTQTLTNKTIDGDNNTVQDLALTTLKTILADANKVLRRDASGIVVSDKTAPTGDFVGTTDTQTLTNKTLTSPELDTALVDDGLDFIEEASFASPSAGRRRLGLKTDGKLYLRDSSGNEKVIGEGSSSGINYIENPDAETDTTGWATYADAAQATPVDGTGGSPAVTWTRTTSTPLRGTGSFLFTKDAANRQGQGASYDFTIDDADKAKVLSISFDYEIASGTYADNDLTVYIYDVTNAQVIQPTGFQILNAGIESKKVASFQTASNSTSYRLILHVASTSASAYTLKFDNVIVGPNDIVQGTPVTDWTSFTPTGSWSTNTTYVGRWRRVGDSAEFYVRVETSGAPTAANLTINLPSGMTIDQTKISDVNTRTSWGRVQILDDNTASRPFGIVLGNNSTSVALHYVATQNAGSDPVYPITNSSPITFAASDTIVAFFSVPIVGWSSNVVMSDSADTRVVAARAALTTTQTAITDKVIPFNSVTIDTHAAFNSSTGVYTVPVPGQYRVSARVKTDNMDTSTNPVINLRKNGVTYSQSHGSPLPVTTTSDIHHINDIVSAVAGDTLDIFVDGDASFDIDSTGTRTIFAIERLSGPSAIAANESVGFRAHGGTTSIPNNTSTDLIFTTKHFDTHNGYNTSTGVYTVPVSGVYQISFRAQLSAAAPGSAGRIFVVNTLNTGSTAVTVSGNLHLTIDTTSRESGVTGAGLVRFQAGDTVKLSGFTNYGVTTSLNASIGENYFCMMRVGN